MEVVCVITHKLLIAIIPKQYNKRRVSLMITSKMTGVEPGSETSCILNVPLTMECPTQYSYGIMNRVSSALILSLPFLSFTSFPYFSSIPFQSLSS
jgi:hypothetical protein